MIKGVVNKLWKVLKGLTTMNEYQITIKSRNRVYIIHEHPEIFQFKLLPNLHNRRR